MISVPDPGHMACSKELFRLQRTNWPLGKFSSTHENEVLETFRVQVFTYYAGNRSSFGIYSYMGTNGTWWSSTENTASLAWAQYLIYSGKQITRHEYLKDYGFSVRCVRD